MRPANACAALALASAVSMLGVGGARFQSERWLLTRFAEHEVAVEIALERDQFGKAWLVGTYTPSRATFHLYGKDLPKSGIHGVARPTLLELVSSTSIRPAGPLVADQPTVDLHVADALANGPCPVAARNARREGQCNGTAVRDVYGV